MPARIARALALALLAAALVASGSRAQEAEDLVPFEKLDVPLRKELWKVCKHFTVRRKLDERKVRCSVETYAWLVEHLPIASVAARELDLGKYVIEDKGESRFSIDDTEGAFAACERVVTEKGRVVVVARGSIKTDPLPETPGTGVIVVRWKQDPDDAKTTLTDAFVFFRVTSESLHLASGPFRDKLGEIVGGKLENLVGCAAKVSAEVDADPQKVLGALERSKKLKAEELSTFRKKFVLD